MKSVYTAQNSIDAHLVKGLLANHGIDARVTGDFLQGAMGELPAFGLVEVRVSATDESRARAIIHAFETDDGFAGDFNDSMDDGPEDGEFEA